jgi:hypothetical protein
MNQSQKQLSLWILMLLVLVALGTERATAQAKSAPFDDADISIAVQQKAARSPEGSEG